MSYALKSIWGREKCYEAPILQPPDAKTDSLEKTLMLGKIEGSRRRGRQDEMVGWLNQLSGLEFEQAPGVGDGAGEPGVLQSMGSQTFGYD